MVMFGFTDNELQAIKVRTYKNKSDTRQVPLGRLPYISVSPVINSKLTVYSNRETEQIYVYLSKTLIQMIKKPCLKMGFIGEREVQMRTLLLS
jgi:hypothetical protein